MLYFNLLIKPEYISRTLANAENIYDVFSFFVLDKYFDSENNRHSVIRFSGAEYLVLGQHYNRPENTGVVANSHKTEDLSQLKEYVKVVCEAIETKKFTFVAHPDILNYIGDGKFYCEEMRKLCVCARENNIPLEINFLGLRTGRNYPNETFWQLVGEEKAPVVFGFDAHDAVNAYDVESLKKAESMVERYNLNFVEIPHIIRI